MAVQPDTIDYKKLFLSMGEGVALCELIYNDAKQPYDFRYLEVNPAFERHSGLKREQVIGRRVRELIPDIEDFWIETYAKVVESGEPACVESSVKGLNKIVEVRAYRHSDNRFVAVFQDVSERYRMIEHMQRKEEWLRAIFETSVDGIVIIGKDGVVKDMNRAARSFFLRSDVVKIGSPFPYNLSTGNREEIRLEQDGCVLELKVAPFEVGSESGYLACLRDISELAKMRDDLKSLAIVDELTKVFNRRGFLALGKKHMAYAKRNRRGFWLMFIDVDGMKWINDLHGHAAGDRALIEFAQVLSGTLRQTDLVARVGGDEFVALTLDATGDSIEAIEMRLRGKLDEINSQPERLYKLSCTIGTAYFEPDDTVTLEDLLARADKKMYERKRGRQSSLFVVRP